MHPSFNRETGEHELVICSLTPETEEALSEIAQENGRTLDKEAESIIKTHLADAAGSAK